MSRKFIASAAVLAYATVVDAVGQAVVVNSCGYNVQLNNVPAAGGGQSEISQSIPSGGSYSQQWTSLTNDQGWSMKLSPGGTSSIIQYEYTYHNDGIIWYDLSAVNGDPFNGDWAISASGGCDPKQTAYRYPTDDEYGMQGSCPDASVITVTLCSGGGGAAPSDPGPSDPAPADPAPAPSDPAPSDPAPSDPPPAAPAPDRPSPPERKPHLAPPSPSIPDPSVPTVPVDDPGRNRFGPPADKALQEGQFKELAAAHTVTHVKTEVVTQFVTVSPSPINKRSEHLHRHAQHHNHF